MSEGDDDGGQKPEYFCENIRSGFKTCGTADVARLLRSIKSRKIRNFREVAENKSVLFI